MTLFISFLVAVPNALLAVYCIVRGRGKDAGWNRIAGLQIAASVFLFLLWSMT